MCWHLVLEYLICRIFIRIATNYTVFTLGVTFMWEISVVIHLAVVTEYFVHVANGLLYASKVIK